MIFLDEFRELDCVINEGGDSFAREFTDFSYDSRLTREGELFVALKTQRDDGCNYIMDAIEAGAAGVICRRNSGDYVKYQAIVIETEDPLLLVQKWAGNRLRKVNPLVVSVTGSLGKTSTKNAVATILAGAAPTFETRQSFNSLPGLPLAMARLEKQHRFAVLELGSNSFGEIEKLVTLFPPRIAVITNIEKVHLKTFGSLDRIAIEKGALVKSLPSDGFALLNGDNQYVLAMKEQNLNGLTGGRFVTFGRSKDCDLYAADLKLTPHGTNMRLRWKGNNEFIPHPPGALEIKTSLLGTPAIYIVLAAVGVAMACGMRLEEIADLLPEIKPVNGRLRPFSLPEEVTLIDDTYSASLPSTIAALESIQEISASRRIVVLGELEDIGDQAGEAHQDLGYRVGKIADYLVCKGDSAVSLVKAARQVNPALDAVIAYTSATVLDKIRAKIKPGDLVLVKGDRISRLETVVKELLPPALKGKVRDLLVRQENSYGRVGVRSLGRPTWTSINLDHFAQNIRLLSEIAKVPVMPVVKADAYGHGAVRLSHTAIAGGAEALAVATFFEAKTLRDAGITAPILILGFTPAWQAREIVLNNLICTVFDRDVAVALSEAAVGLRRNVKIHVKVDTGMARLGLQPSEVVQFLKDLAKLPNLFAEGLYTHFANADSKDRSFTRLQLDRFTKLLAEIESSKTPEGRPLRPPIVHASNSAAVFNFPEARFDLIRPGIACYGLAPSDETPLPEGFKPVLSFFTQIAQLKELPSGTPLSYGCAYLTQKDPSLIATIPVGYADGLKRSPSWREVLVHGRRAKIVGRICMDYALVDVTEIKDVKCGDQVVLIGKQGNDEITATEVAGWLNTINYEVVSTILPRVPRDIIENIDLG